MYSSYEIPIKVLKLYEIRSLCSPIKIAVVYIGF